MGWIIALGVIFGLAILPLGISAVYDTHGPAVFLLIGSARIKIFPAKKKSKEGRKPKTKEKSESTQKSVQSGSKTKEKKGGSVSDFFPLLDSILRLLGEFRRKIRVNCLQLKLILANDDPADLAENYGKAWIALGNIVPLLERCFIIKDRDLEVACDFTADKMSIYGRLDLTITIGRLICLVVTHGFKILRQFLEIMRLRKGGAQT